VLVLIMNPVPKMDAKSSVVRGPPETSETVIGRDDENAPDPIGVRDPLSWKNITGIGSLSVVRRGNDAFAVPTRAVVKAETSIVRKLGPALLRDKVIGPVSTGFPPMVPGKESMIPLKSMVANSIGSDLAAGETASIAATAAANLSAAIPARTFKEMSAMIFLRRLWKIPPLIISLCQLDLRVNIFGQKNRRDARSQFRCR
jgi:hypothetical protein